MGLREKWLGGGANFSNSLSPIKINTFTKKHEISEHVYLFSKHVHLCKMKTLHPPLRQNGGDLSRLSRYAVNQPVERMEGRDRLLKGLSRFVTPPHRTHVHLRLQKREGEALCCLLLIKPLHRLAQARNTSRRGVVVLSFPRMHVFPFPPKAQNEKIAPPHAFPSEGISGSFTSRPITLSFLCSESCP